jgi:starch synthase
MRVLFVTAEAAPFAKVGGLADVAGALPSAVQGLGVDVRVIMPRYASIDPRQHGLQRLGASFDVRGERGARLRCGLWEGRLGEALVYFIEEPRYLTRAEIYGTPDELERFTVFCRGVLAAVRAVGFRPDVIHCNDWHAALLPAWLRLGSSRDEFFRTAAGLLTIHNLSFQGHFDERFRARWELLPAEVAARTVAGVTLNSAMALGLHYADLVTTVSPTYAREVLTPEFGAGLDRLLGSRRERLFGVLNGIDVTSFNPETDPFIDPNYGPDSLERKAVVKATLQRETKLPERSDVPLIGVVSRLTDQKGFDLVLPALRDLLGSRPFQLVVLGTGEVRFHEGFSELARRHPTTIAVYLKFDVALAQRIYAGADLFLMPSRFEPCGLGQMIALRYGTVPVVRATGGLRDTVQEWDTSRGQGNGFVFRRYGPDALLVALNRALDTFSDGVSWRRLQLNGMRADFSWGRSARHYLELYELAGRLRSERL